MILRCEKEKNIWRLDELRLDSDAKIVVCRHFDSVIDQDQNLTLCRLETSLKSSSSESVLGHVRRLHNLSHLKRAALELERKEEFYVKCIQDIIKTLEYEDQIESSSALDETPKRVSRRRTRLRLQLMHRLEMFRDWKEWLKLPIVDVDDENEDDESIPFTIYRRDMERLENAQNLVTRKEIKYVGLISIVSFNHFHFF